MNDTRKQTRDDAVVALCRTLIRQRSYSGEEGGVAGALADFFRSRGFDEVAVDGYGNVVGRMTGKRPGPKILFDGHIDTVPVPDPSVWTHDPFGAEIADGRVYGRGASDMKGAVAAMACAVADFADDTGRDFPGSLFVAGVVHEECFEGIAARSISSAVEPDYVVIGEASELNLKIGQRGRAEIRLETFGVPAHSANPEKGVNAVYKMSDLISAVRSLVPTEHPVLGKGILELTDIKSDPYPGASVVPSYCRATYDRRLLVGETKESVLAPLNDLIARLCAADPQLKAKASYAVGKERCYTGNDIEGERFFPGWVFSEDDAYVRSTLARLREAGFAPEITKYNFCTNGSHYAGERGIRTLGMGPSKENIAHTIDEYVEIEQLTKVRECYYQIIRGLQDAGIGA